MTDPDDATNPLDLVADDSGPADAETGMVEIVDPAENADCCANCRRVRVTLSKAVSTATTTTARRAG